MSIKEELASAAAAPVAIGAPNAALFPETPNQPVGASMNILELWRCSDRGG